jgi:hypothetical protein
MTSCSFAAPARNNLLSTIGAQLSNGNRAPAVCVSRLAPPQKILGALNLPQPSALLILNGGIVKMETRLQTQLDRLLQDGLARAAAEGGVTLLTGGTDAGIFAMLGQGLARWGRTAPCIGVAVAGLVRWANHSQGEWPLQPDHSHFVLVEGEQWGDETATMYALAEKLSLGCPSLAVFAGGGRVTMAEMEANVRQKRKMILLSGSGRTTDAVLAWKKKSDDDDRLAHIAEKGSIVPFSIEQEPQALRELVHCLLFKETGGTDEQTTGT